jgi:UDP-GlcNAc:undecaprenyl-phosphate GlcNAc-1-phosphate transferase
VSFPFNAYLAAVASAFFAAYASLPLWRRWCLTVGLVDDPGHRKIHDQPVPLAGGLAVVTGLLVPAFLASLLLLWQGHGAGAQGGSGTATSNGTAGGWFQALDPHSWYLLEYGFGHRSWELTGILAGAAGMLVLGLLDDKHELRPAPKFAGQLLIAGMVAASGARITLFVHSQVFHYAITILWILTVTNAFNFMDNMNGLCAGLGAIGAGFFASIAAADDQYLVALIAFLTFGSLLGFLPYNFPKARAFLGDAGSHLVGYLLAVLAILPHFYTRRHPKHWAVLIPLLVLAVPLGDLVWVVILRWRLRKPFYIGDNNHLSHRLVRTGLTRTRAVLVIWFLAIAIGALVYLC